MTASTRVFFYYSPLLLVLVVWQIGSVAGLINPSIVPSPISIANGIAKLFSDPSIWDHLGSSLYRQMAGLLLATVVGISVGVSMAHYTWAQVIFEPLVRLIYPLPKSALIPLLILWFGVGHSSKVAAVFLGCLLPIVISSYNGTRGVDKALLWSARSMGTSGAATLWKVYFMGALPEILSGLRIALAMSYTLLISSEFLISRKGMGNLILNMGEVGDYAGMFAAIFIISLIGFLADRLFVAWMNHVLRWRGKGE